MLVTALVRQVGAAGGHAAVLARGDTHAGAVLLLLAERGVTHGLIERLAGLDGPRWEPVGPADPAELDAYLTRRRRSDPDLWVVELDVADARRIVEEATG